MHKTIYAQLDHAHKQNKKMVLRAQSTYIRLFWAVFGVF